MSKPFSSNATSSRDIVMQMLSDICQSLSSSLQLVVTVLSRKCCQLYVKTFLLQYIYQSRYSHANAVRYMSKPFTFITTSNHDIVMKMLSVICQSLSPPIQLVVTIQSCKCCQIYVKAFHLHYNQQSRYSHANAVRYMSKSFTFTTTSSHGIVTRMLSVICQSLSPPIQLVVTIQSRYSN